MSAPFARSAVVGAGLIGASLAGAGRRSGALGHVTAFDSDPEQMRIAGERGLVDASAVTLEEAVGEADLVVLATPVDRARALLERVVAACRADCLLSDVGSVKAPICEEARRLGIAERFVGAHPMAGKAVAGAAAADASLFDGARVVLTPSDATAVQALGRVRELWCTLGSTVVEMDAAAHDEVVAVTSHLPQMLAFALSACASRAGGLDRLADVIGGGWRDTTRLAVSDADMWAAVASENRVALLAAMRCFDAVWREIGSAVGDGNEAALRRAMNEAAEFRRAVAR